MRRRRLWFLALASLIAACAARTELADLDGSVDEDGSVIDATIDQVEPPDGTTIDVTPPPEDALPPPEDALPPPEDALPPPEDALPPPEDALPPPEDSGPDAPPPPECPEDCTSNHECQTQCTPPLTQGRYCCDIQTGSCYAYPHHFCPIQILDAGFD